ncbi:hypothetical protein BDU57DRAFT_450222 [Ampelomyces quisqualis]|uniref:Zn(2)-C6 fungal-type domain-containing protein n=1 Tax=Ampelomyces quisqualis TaxID=50730 RepID=A0A6A5QPG1_AMPQU|nr:hypothetical protein BDU57DRAFT_450222 [Ampelomyces quisqualis]
MQTTGDATSGGAAARRQPSRLPVNPRRVKVAPEERRRVVRACNACNVRRVKCSGDQPCQRCSKGSRECEYPAPESDKGALRGEVDRLRRRCAALEESLQSIAPDNAADVLSHLHRGDSATCSTPPAASHPEPLDPDHGDLADGRLLRDPEGTVRYLGETSGATFLDHLKHFMSTVFPVTCHPHFEDGSSFVRSIGHYQTFDSRPLPNPDVDPLWLPSQTDMTTMLAALRYYIQDGNGDFPSGGIYWWGNLTTIPTSLVSSASLNAMTTDDSFRHLAFYHVCFALASCVGHTPFHLSEQHSGGACFKRARVLMGNPLDTVRFTLSDVPVLTLMAFYLIEINRRDAAYMYLGLGVRIAIIHGAFRACADEALRRNIWTLYVLDRWLSVLMGRPPTIADEAIGLALPSDVPSLPPSAGLRAHVELSRISTFIVCETFKIAPRTYKTSQSTNNIDVALKMLQTWHSQLPANLQMPADINQADPSCCILHMAHNQLILLTTRPIFFAATKQAVARRVVRGRHHPNQAPSGPHISICSAAAHRNLLLAERLMRSGRKLLQAGLHFVFNAAVVLLLKRLTRSTLKATLERPELRSTLTIQFEEEIESSVHFAIAVFEEEARTGTNYQRDCCKILQDLNALTERYLAWEDQADSDPVDTANCVQPEGAGASDAVDPSNSRYLCEEVDSIHEMKGWMQSDGLQPHNSLYI